MKSKHITLPDVEKQLTSYQRLLYKLSNERRTLSCLKPAKSIEDAAITEGLNNLQDSFNLVMGTIKERAAPLVKQWCTLSEISEGLTVKCTNKRGYSAYPKCSVVGIVDGISIESEGIALYLRQALIEAKGQPVHQTNKEEFDKACVILYPIVQCLPSSDERMDELRVAVFLPVKESLRKYYFESSPRLDGEPIVTIYRR